LRRIFLYILLVVILLVIMGILAIAWQTIWAAQTQVGLSSNPIISGLIVAIVGGLIVGIALMAVNSLLSRKKVDLEPIVAAAFYVIGAYAQLNSQRTVAAESGQAHRKDIQKIWASTQEHMETSRLSSDFRSQLRDGSDVTVYLWTKTSLGRIQSGTMLTGLTGDLIFSVQTLSQRPSSVHVDTQDSNQNAVAENSNAIVIYIPPGFEVPEADAVSSTPGAPVLAKVLKASQYDRYGPRWTVVFLSRSENDPSLSTVTVRGVTAPVVAGKYFFKIARVNQRMSQRIRDESSIDFSGLDEESLQFIPIENWPVMLVKGEIHTASISGNIRYGDANRTRYDKPIQEAGKVYAKMTMRIDPYTAAQRPDLPTVDAVGYFNATAMGQYEVEGVAPGIYDLYVSAAGHPKMLTASGIRILRDQSFPFDGHLQPGPVIHGRVLSKRYSHDRPWREASYVKIELYSGPTLSHLPDPSAQMVSWSPLPSLDAEKNTIRETKGPQDVGPPQRWFVEWGTLRPFLFEFGARGEYGAPSDLDGMVPQVYATWVNGLTPGRYYARAWVFHYLQSDMDGLTFKEYWVDVIPNDSTREKTLAIELRT
jgi:hypothetical protein